MNVRDLLTMNIDIDVCDDFDESCYIAFCGEGYYPLTKAGEVRFSRALDVEVEMHNDIAILKTCTENVWDEDEECGESAIRTRACKRLFYSLAGYCQDSDYKKWFFNEYDIISRYYNGEIDVVDLEVYPIGYDETYPLPQLTKELSHTTPNMAVYYEWCPELECIFRRVSY